VTILRALPTIFRVAFAGMVAYRAEMIIWVLSATLPLVSLALWNAAAAEGPMVGFGQVEFAKYFAATLVVRQITGSWVVWELNWQIRTGDLSPRLLRPVHPLVFNLAETTSALPFRAIVLAPVLLALWGWRPEVAVPPEPAVAVAFLASTFLAFVLAWAIQCCFGMLAFWFDQSMGFFTAWFTLWALLSGYVAPTGLLPAGLAQVAHWLPFYSSLGAPVDVLVSAADPLGTLALQAGWVLAALTGAMAMWRAGVRRYGAVGA
jgi:ABC-2 type transport system permease protein